MQKHNLVLNEAKMCTPRHTLCEVKSVEDTLAPTHTVKSIQKNFSFSLGPF